MSGDILFLAHRLPFPPDRGDRIRSHHVLKALRHIAPVHVGCFIDSVESRDHFEELARIAASYCVVRRAKPLALAGLEALRHRQPVSLAAFASKELGDWVRGRLESGRIGAIYVFSGQMGQFVPTDWTGRLIVDLVDVDSAKFEAYAKEKSWPASLVHAREARLLSLVEADLADRADRTLLVSEAEADLLRSRTGGDARICAMGNGIDSHFYDPANISPAPEMAGEGPHLAFTGQMDYSPNVAATERMARRIMPAIRAIHPAAKFHIVGRAPTAQVRVLEGVNGTIVHGAVADMRPFLAAADLVVAPLTIARGVQNKVLEAMAMARPVIASEEAATGIAATPGAHFRVASDDEEFVAHALDLLGDPGRAATMGRAARGFVAANQGWDAILADLPAIVGLPSRTKGARDAA